MNAGPRPEALHGGLPAVANRYYGKYRGTVTDNIDPLMLGRILPLVQAMPGMLLNWALPATPYAGEGVGFYAIPPIGARVWVEFEGGDPSYPIWSGCFWDEGEMPLEPVNPLNKVFATEFVRMSLDDTPGEGGFTITVSPPVSDVLLTMRFDVEGIQISCPESSIVMTVEDITLTVPPVVQTITAELVEVEVEGTTITATGESLVIESPVVEITADVNVTGAVTIEGEVNITGATTVEGEVNITGATTVEGEVNILLSLDVEGEANFLGVVTAEVEVNVLGFLTVEGDANVLGGGQVEGNFAVLGLIEGVVVPPLL
jgi:Uncharacterized protein conserved in bacteria